MTLVAGSEDCPHDRRIVQLLRLVDLVATRVASSVVVVKVLVVVSNRADLGAARVGRVCYDTASV